MKKLQAEIKEYLEERGWDKTNTPPDVAKSIVIEAAELLELFQWGSISKEELLKDNEHFEEVKKELADVFIYCLDMTVVLDIDAEEIIREKLDMVKKKYPAEKVRGNGQEVGHIHRRHRKKT